MKTISTITKLPLHRKCGGCTACCEVLAVKALGKPYDCRCEHQGNNCCLIHDNRPEECRLYECLWLAGAGMLEDRPNRSGLLLSLRVDQGKGYIDIHELGAGIFQATSEGDLSRLCLSSFETLPLEFKAIFGGFCLFPLGMKIGSIFPEKPPYPVGSAVCGGMLFQPIESSCFLLYLGATNGSQELLSGEEPEEVYRKTLPLISGEDNHGLQRRL